MTNHYNRTFLKIFLSYFISVSLFLLISGYLYIQLQKHQILQTTSMQMYRYFVQLKDSNFTYKKKDFDYSITLFNNIDEKLPIKNNKQQFYYKTFSKVYTILVRASYIDNQINQVKNRIIILEITLHILFLILSFILAKISLKPMVDTISHLDRFIGDFVHDLNTPVASIKINAKLISKKDKQMLVQDECKRIEESTKYIDTLYNNMKIIHQKDLIKKNSDIESIILTLIDKFKVLYPNIKFSFDISDTKCITNKEAITIILNNIIQNSCKYSQIENPIVAIRYKTNKLIIEDNGKGMKYPNKIFERNYQEKQHSTGYGIGMHIVHRLLTNLNHKIIIKSEVNKGTKISILF